MTEALQFISNNSLTSALVAAAILAILGGIWKWNRDRRDSKKIFDFMLKSKTQKNIGVRYRLEKQVRC